MGFLDFLFKKTSSDTDITKENDVVTLSLEDKTVQDTSLCLGMEDFNEFQSRVIEAQMKGRTTITFPRVKWGMAVSEKNRRKQLDHEINRTAELNNIGIEREKSGDIDGAIAAYEENLTIGRPATHSYDRLIILYRQKGDETQERRVLNLAIEKFPKETRYQKRLSVLDGTYTEEVVTSVNEPVAVDKVWGEIFEERILRMPEFDFYKEQETNPRKYDTLLNDKRILQPIWEVQRHFKSILEEAKQCEDLGEQQRAVNLYEQAVAEKYYMPTPYDRLVILYGKAKLVEEQKRILEIAIPHFKKLREDRLAYVMRLAKKYGAEEFVQEKIDTGKKITYFFGVFELYNPYPCVEKWEAKLAKLNASSK